MLAALIEETRQICKEGLRRPEIAEVGEATRRIGMGWSECVSLVHSVTESAATRKPIETLKASLQPLGASAEDFPVERFLLILAALDTLDKLDSVPVSDTVKELTREEFGNFAFPDNASRPKFSAERATFVAMCKIATMRRFPAGQFDWEVSGVPRSHLMHVGLRDLPRVFYFVAKLGGLGPVFFSHLNARRKNRSLLETEANKSYYQMARSLALQRNVKGFAASSWFRSPDTHKVSPHLAWLSKVFIENGGMVVTAGAVDPDCGVLYSSSTRKRLYESGEFKPTRGLVIWPREEMLRWAAAHPEYGE
ncbi:MAG TPA: hypothetical protein VIG62_02895 [Blastocatellia bacterium]|jgi:hypothetical protein